MSILKLNPESYTEEGIQNNWAAIYAKREIDNHRDTAVLDHPDGSVTKAKLSDEVKEIISKAEKDANTAVSTANTAVATANTANQRAISADTKSDAAVSSASVAVQRAESVQSDVSKHTSNNDIHVSKEDKDVWNNKADAESTYSKAEIDAMQSQASNAFTELASEFESYKGSTPNSLKAEALELGDNVTVNAENARLAIGGTVYSTMPQRIGVWTDGTPIWRVAFEKTIPTGTSDNKSDVIVSILLSSTCKNTKLIDCDCFSTNTEGGFGATHHQKDNISFMNNGIMNISFQNGTNENILYGWVEFVAPYSSIYPNDCYMDYRQSDGTYRMTGQQANEILVKIPEAFIGKDNICFSMSIKKTAYQQIDIAYGDGNDVLLSSLAVTNSSVYEAVSLYNAGYPATANSWFKIRCHSGNNEYLTVKDIVIGEV
ncbi:MAG: hypothetical protein PUF08_04195 [Clostridiales bacterium]|nr:hypothetical protein [Clostridiales bacterium]